LKEEELMDNDSGAQRTGSGRRAPDPTHQRDVRVHIAATAVRPPRRGQPWSIEVGRWRAEGVTEKAAVAAITGRLRQFLTDHQGPRVVSFRGYVAVVAVDLGDDYRPLRFIEQVIKPGGQVAGWSSGSADTWEQAEAQARYGLAQRTTDWHDDGSVHEAAAYLAQGPKIEFDRHGPSELYHYAAWQRAAKAALAADRDDWHEWAHEHYADFTITQPETGGAVSAPDGEDNFFWQTGGGMTGRQLLTWLQKLDAADPAALNSTIDLTCPDLEDPWQAGKVWRYGSAITLAPYIEEDEEEGEDG
jgi:hypothetical protein